MFYDDLHPSADMHALLASYFYEQLSRVYKLLEPDEVIDKRIDLSEQQLLLCFREHYQEAFTQDKNGFFSPFRTSKLDYKNASLDEILRHALDKGGARTFAVLVKLGWLSESGELVLACPALKDAMAQVRPVTLALSEAAFME